MSHPRRLRRWLIALAIATVVLPVVLFVAVDAIGRRRARAVQRAWERELGSFDALLAKFPAQGDNNAAREVQALAAQLSLDFTPIGAPPPKRSIRRKPPAELGEYVEGQLESESDTPQPPPPQVASWLELHRSQVDALVTQLVTDEAPRWACEASRGLEARIPPPGDQRRAQRILAAAALEKASAGNDVEALRMMDAAWKLSTALRARPELISQLMAIADAKMQLGTLRKLSNVPEEWEARIAEHDYRASMRSSLQWEAWAALETAARRGGTPPVTSYSGRAKTPAPLVFVLQAPARSLTADAASRMLDALRDDIRAAPCVAPRVVQATTPPAWRQWEPLDDLTMPNLAGALARAHRLAVDAEMTREVLRARRERTARSAKGSCPDWTIETEVLPDGRMSVRVEGTIPEIHSGAFVLPLRWAETAPAASAEVVRSP